MLLQRLARYALPLMAAIMPAVSHASEMQGSDLSIVWAIPFAGILLSIALVPLIFPDFWHNHFGKVSLAWAAVTIIPLSLAFGLHNGIVALNEALVGDFIPFILFVGTLFVVAGGIHISGNFTGRPVGNLAFLITGAALANIMGTTGAAMLMIRPLLKATEHRKYRMHTFIFFIFMVANIGGSLTPLGDPPLFLGYLIGGSLTPLGDPPLFMGFLRGVSFFWTAQHTLIPMLTAIGILSVVYLVIDSICWKKEHPNGAPIVDTKRGEKAAIQIRGGINFMILAVVIGAVLLSGVWKSGFSITFFGVTLTGQGMARDALFVLCIIASLILTPKEVREKNQFSWDPIFEVAKLFAGIFVCMGPVLAMLKAGSSGAFAPLVALVSNSDGTLNNSAFFWLSGALSSFLDNTPTYLAFFNLAGGDPTVLMGADAVTLLAISLGSVFMGANTYIGNAPNFMVLSIAQSRGVKMPSFFGYMAWSVGILVPTDPDLPPDRLAIPHVKVCMRAA